MTRFEALGVLPDKPHIPAYRYRKDTGRYEERGYLPIEEVVDMFTDDCVYKLQRAHKQSSVNFVVKASRIVHVEQGVAYRLLYVKADGRKVLRNKKRFDWKFKSDKKAGK